MLMVNGANYEKTPRLTARYGRRTLGHGLFTASNAEAASMRRPVQGAFRRTAIADRGPSCARAMEERVERWRPGQVVELSASSAPRATVRTRILFGDRPPDELESMLPRAGAGSEGLAARAAAGRAAGGRRAHRRRS